MAACALTMVAPWAGHCASGKAHDGTSTTPERSHPDHMPAQPTVPPAFSIPLDPLGFSPPGQIYLGQRWSLVSLDFLDEDRLLFTFRVPGLLHRESAPSGDDQREERHIKALVLSLPGGKVEAEAMWTLHDRLRYLWMLKGGHFLVRDQDQLQTGDASLELKPYLRFPGQVLTLEMDPAQDLLVTNSREPAAEAPAKSGEAGSAANAVADVTPTQGMAKGQGSGPDMVLRILRRDSGKVMLVSRVRSEVHLPINAEGYLELLPGRREDWVVNLNNFGGGSAKLGEIESSCSPSYDFVSPSEFLISACSRQFVRGLMAMSTDGRRLWQEMPTSSPVWPVLVVSAGGSRVARESLCVNHLVNAYSPLSFDDVKGQLVEVFDSATGKIALAAPASPVFDAGGNVAISASGRRVAVLNAGAIQVFDLPAPPPAAPGPVQASKSGP
jgi:hypothetical protein